MSKFFFFVIFISQALSAGSTFNIKKVRYLSYNKKSIKLVSKGKVYLIDNKIAMLPIESVCDMDISVPPSSIKKVSKASKKQLKLKCVATHSKNKRSR